MENNAIVERFDDESAANTLSEIIKDLTEKYDEKLSDLQKELSDVFEIDQYSLVEENMKTISRLHLWIGRLAIERRSLLKIKRKRDITFSKLYEDFREGKRGHITLNNNGIEAYINRIPEFQKWDSWFNEQQIIVDYIDQICWALKQTKMSALKNIQDSKKLEGS
jgi:hypothetical protein